MTSATVVIVLWRPTVKELLVADVKAPPATVARSVYVPAVSICRFVKVATPLAALVPMSTVVVPSSVPPPLKMEIVSTREDGSPMVEYVPEASTALTTGCVPNGEPTSAPPGCVVKASAVAGRVVMLNAELVAGV